MKSETIENQAGKFRKQYNCMTGKYEIRPIEPRPEKPTSEEVDRWYVAYLENQNQLLSIQNEQLKSELFLLELIHNAAKQLIQSLNGEPADIL